MAKYRVVKPINSRVKVGDVVELNDPIIPEYKDKLVPASEDDEVTTQTAGDNDHPVKTAIVNPNRDELKDRASKLGINFASNIPTVTLIELIQEAEAKRQDGTGEGQGDDKDEDKE